jgi:phytoene dehydrogenase-like protein
VLPLSQPFTAALGLLFAVTAHVEDWPVAQGGSHAITHALASYLESLGGDDRDGPADRRGSTSMPPARVVLFDTSPDQLASIAATRCPRVTAAGLGRYRYGPPGAFKVDWALDGPIPWRIPSCLEASTVHVGGTLEEICASERDMYAGRTPSAPYLILCQQSEIDPARAPAGKHTGYAYCHVPHGSTIDRTEAIEAQIERFAPGFRDRILARHAMNTAWFEHYNPNYVGGAITGGVADALQLFNRTGHAPRPLLHSQPAPVHLLRRHSARRRRPRHGGYWAAQSALKRLR